MKNYLIFIVTLFAVTIILAGCNPENLDEAKISYTGKMIPQGAKLIEMIPTKNQNDTASWYIFKFRKQCFLMHSPHRRAYLTNINCPKDK